MTKTGRKNISGIVRRLRKMYGHRPPRKHGTGIDGLVQTILSQSTSDANSSAAFRSLKNQYPSWIQVLGAPTEDVEHAIRSGGLSRMKAPRIQNALQSIRDDTGRLSLAFLARRSPDDAREYLEALDGVGPKTAACVLMFCYNMPVLPVDTHVHRVAGRLGLIPERCSAPRAHRLLEESCPPECIYEFHVLMVEHGRATCRARAPRCDDCALSAICPSAPHI